VDECESLVDGGGGDGAKRKPAGAATGAGPGNKRSKATGEVLDAKVAEAAMKAREAGPDGYCSPRHPTRVEPSIIDLNDIL